MTRGFRSGAVLVGGSSRRMGTPKEWIEVDGAPLVARPLAALAALGVDELITVGGPTRPLETLLGAVGSAAAVRAQPDWYPGAGPLGGLITALGTASAPEVAVLACDLPTVDPVALETVWRALHGAPEADAAVGVATGRVHPLHAVYRRGALPALLASFEGGERAVMGALVGLSVIRVDVPDASVQNWNERADVACNRHQKGDSA